MDGNNGTITLNHVIASIEYGESLPNANDAKQRNLKGEPYKVYDSSGLDEEQRAGRF